MTAQKLSRMAAVAGTAMVLAAQAMALGAANEKVEKQAPEQQAAVAGAQKQATEQQAVATSATKRVIVVSLEDRKLALVEDGQVKKVYSVAVGKPSTPSPVGTFTIERRVANPTYHHNGKTVLPGPGNPVGTRWMGLSKHGYGIHGTNEPKSIGKAASHGCIRMSQADLEEFYELVAVGDTVELVGERNQETAQLFGDGQNPAAAAQPAQTAQAAPAAGQIQAQATAQAPVAGARNTEKANPAASAIATLVAAL
ncbi:MAG: L,D-transpeptidase [Terracidiphilus sp.]|jgi:lipoprotein-anchoring transpeptidase ErfK/SrfK